MAALVANHMNKIYFIILAFILSSCEELERERRLNNFDEYHISIIKLITFPEKYHRKPVQIEGYVNLEFEGNEVCLHKDDSDNGLSRNCLWISGIDEHETNKAYAIVSGTFNMENLGHGGAYAGSIEKIERIRGRN